MKQKLNKILLIDDSDADNFIHKRVIQKAGIAHEIIVKNSGEAALEYLSTEAADGQYPTPELVLLDINMPSMNGWEFLDAYNELSIEQKADIIVCMLTTSTSPKDSAKAKTLPQIKSYLNKPLNLQGLTGIFRQHFPELVEGWIESKN